MRSLPGVGRPVAIIVVVLVLFTAGAFAAGLFSGIIPYRSTTHTTPGSPSTYHTTILANSTYTLYCPQNATCDYAYALTINVTCTGCSFIGRYSSSYSPAGPTQVSGTGSRSFSADYFDSPISLSWSISKNSSEGTLEVKVISQSGQMVLYDRITRAPFGNLSGVWDVAVASQSSGGQTTVVASGTSFILGRAPKASFCCPATAKDYNVFVGSGQTRLTGCLSSNSTVTVLVEFDTTTPAFQKVTGGGCFSFPVSSARTYLFEIGNQSNESSAMVMITSTVVTA